MNVVIPIDITRDEVEELSQVLESSTDEILTNFILKVLKKTHEITCSMEAVACEIKDVNPISMCNIQK